VLNSAIIAADIGRGWEGYLEIFDAFYADEVEVTTRPTALVVVVVALVHYARAGPPSESVPVQ
jgi:hypothetical protein